jgi:hypothetical protein
MKVHSKILFVLALGFCFQSISQDTIFSNKYPYVLGEVQEVNASKVIVHLSGTPEGEFYSMKRKHITKIHYAGDSLPMILISEAGVPPGLKPMPSNWSKSKIGLELFAPVFGFSVEHNLYKDYLSVSFHVSTNINHGAYEKAGGFYWNPGVRLDENQSFLTYSSNNDNLSYQETKYNTINSQLALRLNSYLFSPLFRIRPYVSLGLGLANVHYRQQNSRYYFNHFTPNNSGNDYYSITQTNTEGIGRGYTRELGLGVGWAVNPALTIKAGLSLFQVLFTAPSPIVEGYDKTDHYSRVGGEMERNIGFGIFFPVSFQFTL